MRAHAGIAPLVVLILPIVVALGGCVPSVSISGSPSASARSGGSRSPSSEGVPASPSTVTSSAPAGSAGAGLAVDARLLGVLPAEIGGIALVPDPTTAAQIAADPTLASSAEAIAVALAIRPGTSSSGDDLAIVSVIRLRPGVFGDAWFVTWRTTYDQAACEVAGGVRAQPSQTSIAGRTVYLGTCAGDAETYHVHLADPTLVVSITAAGPNHFGELVVAGLAE